MSRMIRVRRWAALGLGGLAVVALAFWPLPGQSPARAQQPAAAELPAGLKFIPPDAALFLHVDVAKVWDNKILKDLRKADAKTFDFLLGEAKKELGLAPE